MRKKSDAEDFFGFKPETVNFLDGLAQNNTRDWFQAHRHEYETHFLAPAYSFVNTLGGMLSGLTDGLQYEARVDKSIFRLNRDTRFSKEKSPYKNNLGIIFWKGPYTDRKINPCFYFHLEPNHLFLATGYWYFPPEIMAEYRQSLLDKKHGNDFLNIAKKLESKGMKIESEFSLAKPPKGFDKNHPLAEYAKSKGICVSQSDIGSLPDIVFRRELLDYCVSFYSETVDIFNWMADLAYRAA